MQQAGHNPVQWEKINHYNSEWKHQHVYVKISTKVIEPKYDQSSKANDQVGRVSHGSVITRVSAIELEPLYYAYHVVARLRWPLNLTVC